MYGLMGRMLAAPGKRDELAAMMAAGMTNMPGCKVYVVAADATDENAIWISEVWDTAESHQASLQLEHVQALIGQARPLIVGMDSRVETNVIGGIGI